MKSPQIPRKQFTREQLEWAEDLPLTEKQLSVLLAPTPAKFKYSKPGKGNSGRLEYVSIGYILNILNLLFGWDWDFQILDKGYDMQIKQCWVHGRLTVRTQGHTIIKEQFGSADIACLKSNPEQPVDLGNSLKGAASDALKKAASELGVARDVYHKDEYSHIEVLPESQEILPQHSALKHYLANADTTEEIDFVLERYQESHEMDDKAEQIINQKRKEIAQ